MQEVIENNDPMKDLRDKLQQVIWDNEKLLEDRVFALATGSFAISLTIFQIQKSWVPLSKWLILASWVILLAAVILIVYSLYYARNGAEKAIKSPNSNLGEVITSGNKKTKRLNAISYYLTLGGYVVNSSCCDNNTANELLIMSEELNRRIIYPSDKPIQQKGLTMPINIPIPVSQTPIDVGNGRNQETK